MERTPVHKREESLVEIIHGEYGKKFGVSRDSKISKDSKNSKSSKNSQNSKNNKLNKLLTNDYTTDYSSGYVRLKDMMSKRNKKNYTPQLAQAKAQYIARKLNNPSRMNFYLKCAWNLNDEYLDGLLDLSLKKKKSIFYFSASASNAMIKNGR